MTDTYFVAPSTDGQASFEYAGPTAGPAGLAVLELAGIRIVADGAKPSRLVELTVDDDDALVPIDGHERERDAVMAQLGIERVDPSSVASGLRIAADRAAALARFAFACDESERADNIDASLWSVDVVVLADRLGVTATARAQAAYAHVARAAAALLANRDRLTQGAVDAANVVARYCADRSVAARLTQLVANVGPHTDVNADGDVVTSPALVQRDETRARVAGALALHPVAVDAGVHVARAGRLVWHPALAQLHVEVDIATPPAAGELWLRAIDSSGGVVALAPLTLPSGDDDPAGADASVRRASADLRVGAHNDLTAMTFEVTGDPTTPALRESARARDEAIADGRAGASAARMGRWPIARDAWLRCARAWARAGDPDRQALALVEAAGAFDRLGASDEGRGLRQRAIEVERGWASIDQSERVHAELAFVADALSR